MGLDQCDKVARQFYNNCPFKEMKICPIPHQICQSMFNFFQYKMKTLKFAFDSVTIANVAKFTQSGHTGFDGAVKGS